jgi:hypothetical protein
MERCKKSLPPLLPRRKLNPLNVPSLLIGYMKLLFSYNAMDARVAIGLPSVIYLNCFSCNFDLGRCGLMAICGFSFW